jgi:hypothetical protein
MDVPHDSTTRFLVHAVARAESVQSPVRKLLFNRLNLAMTIVFVVGGVVGWVLGPSSSSPPAVPPTPSVHALFEPVPQNFEVVANLSQLVGGTARLSLIASGSFRPTTRVVSWQFDLSHLTGHPCSNLGPNSGVPPMVALRQTRQGPNSYDISGSSTTSASTEVFADVRVCWGSDPPIVTNGPFLSAALPQVLAGIDQGSLTRVLRLEGTSLFEYSLQSGTSPTVTTGRSLLWTNPLSQNVDSPSSEELPVSGASIPGLQRDNQRSFISGILLGIAGGAFVTLLASIVTKLDDKKRLERDALLRRKED